ncbi:MULTISPECIES: LacI family DNA-binding transcriptional regulator [Paenibacillus]|uniref:LacI family transcriptional regulator n=1 Tax=Paenibacillus aceti TaxID=1820010 RepID=A0ABQ1VRU0_9BACL|nr:MULTISPECIES: LacI family DNA-binding transcriptional regulator [Paenibacillus]NWL88508.1 LacI family DNA-binding transcriptional regulator [Paenibacillus sp. 79R4]GGF93193.1 LacI family transcriptional regulator [Paenibacillus aceti]
MKSKVTMQDIADQLNLSKNSVSQAISGKDGVSEETRKLILDTAEQMGYIYQAGRKKSQTDQSGYIALIASDFAFAQKGFFGEIYLSVEQETRQRGKQLLIQSISQESEEALILPPILENQGVEGILILSHLSTPYMNKVISKGLPTVLIDHHYPAVKADCILTNNRFAAYEAIHYLTELGHRNIGFVGDINFSPSYYERYEGFRLAMREAGLEMRKEWLLLDATEQTEYMMNAIKSIADQPTAWFCVNDGLGFILNSTLQQQGFQIPQQVSICSFDNGQLSQLSTPLTTTMGIDLKTFGRKAVEQLFWRMDHKHEPFVEILLPTMLIARESTTRPRESNVLI